MVLLFANEPRIVSAVRNVTVPEEVAIVMLVVDALLLKVFVPAPEKTTWLKSVVAVFMVPAIVWGLVPSKYTVLEVVAMKVPFWV